MFKIIIKHFITNTTPSMINEWKLLHFYNAPKWHDCYLWQKKKANYPALRSIWWSLSFHAVFFASSRQNKSEKPLSLKSCAMIIVMDKKRPVFVEASLPVLLQPKQDSRALSPLHNNIKFSNYLHYIIILLYFLLYSLWQYRLWSFQAWGTKLERFLPKKSNFGTFWHHSCSLILKTE